MNKLSDWKPVIEKFKSRLSGWKMRSLSFGGRVVLIKSVLNSLPLYYFSLFRAPPSVLKILESVRRGFFWGGADSGHKIAWVKWENVINSYGNGGLNFGSLKGKNLALLGKWWWRFKTETESFWVKVISSIYGSCGGLLAESDLGHSMPSTLWRNIILAGTSIEELQVGFKHSFLKTIGDGGTTLFWDEHWIGRDKLRNLYPRLFRLEHDKKCSIKDRLQVSGEGAVTSGSGAWQKMAASRSKNSRL
ncbi:uncharacterized mitochondrial protein AtMg00310-like [Rutidosis leptorrhynchoides]|uniref:uncharacterized mitochondrial protein AtMg00310-like n=1 Tax=Rutidosis leptorrhynchoides TaxID=125765 RepID=UPI003A98D8A6